MKKLINTPTARAHYVQILIDIYKPDWLSTYKVTKTDIREMSLKSLRVLYNLIKNDNFYKALGGT